MIRVLRQLLTVILSLILAVPAFSNSYDNVGNLAAVTYPNGVVHSYGYDNRNRLTNLGVGKGAANLASYAYVLDASGHRTQVTELSGRTVSYSYDNLYRLTSEAITLDPAAVNGAVNYTYDAVGNRTRLTSTLAAVPAGLWNYDANDRFTAGDTYDNNGNTVSSGGIGNVYDFENRLIQKGGVTIVYDGDGNRVKKTVAGVTTTYLVDDQNPTGYAQVLTETLSGNGTGNRELSRKYVYGLERISQRRQFVQSGSTITDVKYYGYDGHGSVRALTDQTGAVTDTYDYDAFGNLIHSTGTTPNEFLFAGEQFDPDLNLYYNRARYLNTSTGRFWTMDSFEGRSEDPLSLHKYLYAAGDPVGRRDPSGRDFADTLGAIAINVTLTAQAILSYAVIVTSVAGVVYVSTGVAISVDENFFGGSHTESLYTLRDGAGYVFFVAYFVTDAAQSLALVGPGARKPAQAGVSKTIQVPKSLYPESAQHIEDAQAAGQPLILTIDRSNAAQRRAEALQGFANAPGLDRDEFPPAVFAEGGSGASVRPISPSDNRGSGAFIGNQLRGLPDGAKVKLEAVDDVPK